MYRAFESDRPDALFRDPFARRPAGDRGDAIVHSLPVRFWLMDLATPVLFERT